MLWALAQLGLYNQPAGVVFFGGLALLSLAGMAHIYHPRQASMGSNWAPMALTTSVVPFLTYI